MTTEVTTLDDSGPGSLREAIQIANETGNSISFSVSGTIILNKELPKIKADNITINGNKNVTIDFNEYKGLKVQGDNVTIAGLSLVNSCSSGLELNSRGSRVISCSIGIDFLSEVKPNRVGILIEDGCHNIIGDNPDLDQEYYSNTISNNFEEGIKVINSHSNQIINNVVESNKNGIVLINSHYTKIGGIEFVDKNGTVNNPTGDKGTIPGVFVRPLFGNLVSLNKESGVLVYASENCQLSGNFIGTDRTGTVSRGNKHGVIIEKSRLTSLVGCKIWNNPFVYYNVISGNDKCGILVQDSTLTTIQGNFIGISATNAIAVPNSNGVVIGGNSTYTTFGGRIPLGNVVAGNCKNGIVLTDQSSNFISFNTFAGLSAFGPIVSNGENGFLLEENTTENTIRTNVISGNLKNGIEIKDDASDIEIICNIIGLDTLGTEVFPNVQNGILIKGNAKGISIENDGVPSIIPRNTISGNLENGISIEENASEIEITGSIIGFDLLATKPFGHQHHGVFIDKHASHVKIGDITSRNYITSTTSAAIFVEGENNTITGNSINTNILLERVPDHKQPFVDISSGNTNLYYGNDDTY